MYYVYVLQSEKDKNLHIGYTSDLKQRFAEHNGGQNLSTKHRRPFELIYYEAYSAEKDARNREKKLKKLKNGYQRLKERIINSIKK